MPGEIPKTLRNGAIATIAAVLVGILGFGFHLSADLAGTGQMSLERILAFAPVFAPLLFSDLGALGLLVVAESEGSGAKI